MVDQEVRADPGKENTGTKCHNYNIIYEEVNHCNLLCMGAFNKQMILPFIYGKQVR